MVVSVFLNAGGSLGGAELVARRRPARTHACASAADWYMSDSFGMLMSWLEKMDFQSAMETFAEAWAAANTAKSEAPSDLSQASDFY